MDDLISRQAAIDAVEESRRLNHHQDGKEACAHEYEHRHFLKILSDLPSAQSEPYIDSIVSEIKKTISETKKSGKHHEIHIRTNGEMICYGLQLALDIIEEKKNERIN